MRWLWCILSWEFDPEETLIIWDYLFSGIDPFFLNLTKYNNMYLKEDYSTSMNEPLIFLDLMCVSMLVHIWDELYGQDNDHCLMTIFNYPKVSHP